MGAGIRRVADRPRRGTLACDAAVETFRVHERGSRQVRASGTRRRGTGAGNVGGDPPVRTFAGRALPLANDRAVASGNPSARAAKDRRERLISFRCWSNLRLLAANPDAP